jgi:inosose dehydratase
VIRTFEIMTTRRSFLKQAGLVTTAALSCERFAARAQETSEKSARRDTFRLGMAGYTFNKFKLEPALEMLKKVDVHYLCIKDFHLPLKSTEQEIAAFHEKCRSFHVTGYGVGPIYMGSPQEVDDAFAYTKRVGVNLLVGIPYQLVEKKRAVSTDLLKRVDEKVREYDVRYAIHNHGPDMPRLFPSAESAMELIQDLDKRIGLCLDIGHEFRDGKDPVKAVTQFADRLYDVHLKNETAPDRRGRAVELPRGAIDLAAFVHALRTIGYSGVCGLEYEKDMDNPLAGIAECVGYFRGLMDATR